MTPARSADFARAIALVRPITRRRLYWTARAVLVSDPAHVKGVRRGLLLDLRRAATDEPFDPGDAHTVPAPADDRPPAEHTTSPGDAAARESSASVTSSSPDADDDSDRPEVDLPLALSSDEERLAGRSFDSLAPHELAQLYRLMSRLQLATPLRQHTPPRARPARTAHRHAAHAAHQPAHRRRSDSPRPPAPARRTQAARAAVRHLGLDGAVRPRVPAVPDLRSGQRAERRGVRLRHPADPPDAGARVAAAPSVRSSAPPPLRPTGRAEPASATRSRSSTIATGAAAWLAAPSS